MQPASFTAWRKRLGLTKVEAARQLGISRNSVARYENGEQLIPVYIALACAALAHGLPGIS